MRFGKERNRNTFDEPCKDLFGGLLEDGLGFLGSLGSLGLAVLGLALVRGAGEPEFLEKITNLLGRAQVRSNVKNGAQLEKGLHEVDVAAMGRVVHERVVEIVNVRAGVKLGEKLGGEGLPAAHKINSDLSRRAHSRRKKINK